MDEFPKIAVSGDLGSGKSLICRLLKDKLNYRIVSTGEIQREIAEKMGMSTLELNNYTASHPEIDDAIDSRIGELGKSAETLIFDSRLAWHFAPESFKVFLLVDEDVSAERIFRAERKSEKYQSIAEAKKKIMERRSSELERFRVYYGIDYSDLGNYDLIVETSHASPEFLADHILQLFEKWMHEQDFAPLWLSPLSLYPTYDEPWTLEPVYKNISPLIDFITAERERRFYIVNNHAVVSSAIISKKQLLSAALLAQASCSCCDSLHYPSDETLRSWQKKHGFSFSTEKV